MARSIHEEIIEWKARRGPNDSTFELINKLEELQDIWQAGAALPEGFSDFIPMRLATILEVFVREAIRELIDLGSPYNELAKGFSKNLRIDFLIALNLQGQKLSLGDFIAHTVAVSDIDQVIASFEILIPNFRENMAKTHERWTEDMDEWPDLPPIIDDMDDVLGKLKRLLTIRHIVTHEVPAEKPYDKLELGPLIDATLHFAVALDWLLVEKLQGHLPRQQLTMNMSAGEKLTNSEATMNDLVDALANREDVDATLFKVSQQKWAEFADAEANFRGSLVQGGSMYPMVWAHAKAELVEDRTVQLQWWTDRKEGQV
jgi:uncharacterized protein YecT (DUF1311 family)